MMTSAAVGPSPLGLQLTSTAFFSSSGKRSFILSLALILFTVLVYSRIGQNSFINVDDGQYITQNPQIVSGLHWGTLNWALATEDAANWHPLTWISHAMDCQLFGLNPAGHHFMGVLLHSANAVLLFLLLQSITGFAWRSLMVAALFAVHPLNVESVAWAAERKNLLSMFFFLLALWAYRSYMRSPAMGRYLAVAGLFACALMAKPQVVTLPLVLLLLDYWPLHRARLFGAPNSSLPGAPAPRSIPWLVAEKVPLLLLSALSAMLTLQVQREGHAVRTTVEYSVSARIENAIFSYFRYLVDCLFPRHLAPMYPHPANSLDVWKVATTGATLLAISALVVIFRRRQYLPVGWLWFLGILVPMIGLVQVGMQARADRYTYLPMIGIFVILVWGIADLATQYRVSMAWVSGVSGLVLAALGAATFNQVGHWRNSETLWTYTLRVTDRNFMAEDNLAQELAHQGRVREALVHFHNTLSLYDWGPTDLVIFGTYEQHHGYSADAIAQFERALQNTADSDLRMIALNGMGSAYLDLKDEEHSRQSFENALQLNAKNVSALVGLGVIAHRQGDMDLAIRQYGNAVSIAPSDLAYLLLGQALQQSGRSAEAQRAYQQAQRLTSNLEQTRLLAEHMLAH